MVCLLGVTAQQVNAAGFEVAEDLLVDLRSEDLAAGAVAEWPNRGSLGGVFTAGGNPVVATVGDWEDVVSLDGTSYFVGPASPPGIVGNGTRSIEVWAYNIGESKEECMVCWSHRGGPDGTNMNFNYGWKDFGAAGHWGDDADMAWKGFDNASGGTGGYPALETWQYLVYTYDGSTVRLYVNGELNNERAVFLNTHAGNTIRIGCQNNSDDSPAVGEKAFSGAIAQVRIHDGVLTPEQIQRNAQVRSADSATASKPSPGNGASDVLHRNLMLSWSPGEHPGTHTVYFSEDRVAVESGTAAAVSGSDANSYDPGPLEFGRTYFWRVDEVNATPDHTIMEGDLWSFTVEPYSRAIPTGCVIATASGSANATSGPEKTADGSGLDDLDGHDTTAAAMWTSGPASEGPAWIQYEFDTLYKLHQMWVWNSNNALEWLVGLGVKTATVEHSTDGVTWTALADVPEFAQAPGAADYVHNTTVEFGGVAARFVRITCTRGWGNSGQYGLSEVRFFSIPVSAQDPKPATGAAAVPLDATLAWRPGRDAASHEIHLGTDLQAVEDSTVPVATVSEALYAPVHLQLGATYYWKVVEVNQAETPSAWEGKVWSFSTSPYQLVDDFESYSDASPNRVFQAWIDGAGFSSDTFFPSGGSGNGTGSLVGNNGPPYAERTVVHSGGQSMPLGYNGLSETTRTFSVAQDWTQGGITTLVLFFRGESGNAAGELYVKINGTKVSYSGSTADLTAAEWKQWDISLPAGANLGAVGTLTIGVSSGQGKLYIDDIRLVRTAP